MVVITIIAILLAVLLPALGKVREQASYARWLNHRKQTRANPSVVAYYPLDERSFAPASVASGSHPVIRNQAVARATKRGYRRRALDAELHGSFEWREGRWSSKDSLYFNGANTYLDAGDPPQLNLREELTIEAWAKSLTPNWKGSGTLGSKRNGHQGYVLLPKNNSKLVQVHVGDESANGGWYGHTMSDPIKRWHHYVMTYDSESGEIALYVDGEKRVSAHEPAGRLVADVDHPLWIGRGTKNKSRYGRLLIGEWSIWDRALGPAEIEDRYAQSAPVR